MLAHILESSLCTFIALSIVIVVNKYYAGWANCMSGVLTVRVSFCWFLATSVTDFAIFLGGDLEFSPFVFICSIIWSRWVSHNLPYTFLLLQGSVLHCINFFLVCWLCQFLSFNVLYHAVSGKSVIFFYFFLLFICW